jgi:hypothetical protein
VGLHTTTPKLETTVMRDDPEIIYVREEPPNLLWRSIVQGFGFGIGLIAVTLLSWLVAIALLVAVFHNQAPAVPTF